MTKSFITIGHVLRDTIGHEHRLRQPLELRVTMTEYSTPDIAHSNGLSLRSPTHQSDSLSVRVVEAVAHAANCSSSELEPLYDIVDPDALNTLFAPTMEGKTRTDGKLEFEYAGYDVVVHSSGAIDVVELNTSEESETK